MACTDPGITSPGKLFLGYTNSSAGVRAEVSWNLKSGVSITGLTALGAEAQRLAVLLADCFITPVHITDWGVKLPNGSTYHAAPLASPQTGAHTLNGNMQAWKSTTVAFIGTATPSASGLCHGRVIARVHTFGALDFPPGSTFYPAVSDSAYLTFINDGLNDSDFLPADKYGQPAVIETNMPVQWNAAYQHAIGS